MDRDPSSPTPSRPGSSARSDSSFVTVVETPESPHGPRSLAREIEHIKSLIFRAWAAAPTQHHPHDATIITAQVFRPRADSHGQVTQARIFHELDLLKFRIRQEHHHLHHARRPSQVDPDTESEADDVPDERDEELEHTRRELEQVRQQREALLAAAEGRIDRLTDEKDELAVVLAKHRSEVESIESQKAASEEAGRAARDELGRRLNVAERSLQGVLKQIEDHAGEKRESDAALAAAESRERELRRDHDDLHSRHKDLEAEAQASRNQIVELEGGIREHLARLQDVRRDADLRESEVEQLGREHEDVKKERDEHRARSEAATEECRAVREELQRSEEAHRAATEGAETKTAELERKLEASERRVAEAEAELKTKEAELAGELASSKDELAELRERLAGAEEQLSAAQRRASESEEVLQAEKAKVQQTLARKDSELAALQGQSADHQLQLSNARAELDQKTSEASRDGEAHRSALDDLRSGHVSEMEHLKSAHATELGRVEDEVRRENEAEVERLRDAHQRALDETKEQSEDRLRQTRDEHSREIERLAAEHGTAMEEATREANERHDETLRQSKAELKSNFEDEIGRMQAQIQSIKDDGQTALSKAGEDHQTALSELAAEHLRDRESKDSKWQAQIQELRADHATQIDALKKNYELSSGDSDSAHQHALNAAHERLALLQGDHATAMSELTSRHEEQVAQLQEQHEAGLNAVQAQRVAEADSAREELDERGRAHEAQVASLVSEHGKAIDGLRADLAQARLEADESRKSFADEMARVEGEHGGRLDEERNAHGVQMEEMRQKHDASLLEQRTEAAEQLQSARRAHEEALEAAKAEGQEALSRAHEDHEDRARELDARLAKTHEEHERVLAARLEAAEDISAAKVAELERRHAEKLREMDEHARADVNENGSEAQKRHRDEIDALKSSYEETLSRQRMELRQEAYAQMLEIERRHDSALHEADGDTEGRLRDQADAHARELDGIHQSLHTELAHLQTQLDEAEQLRQKQMQTAEISSQRALAELGEKLQTADKSSSELAAKHSGLTSEFAALQARLDIEFTARAEAERSLAELRKQRFDVEKRSDDGKDALLKQVAELQAERDALAKQNESFASSRREMKRRSMDLLRASSSSRHMAPEEELLALKQQLVATEMERNDATALAQQKGEERSELVRQNDFLVKELERMMSQLSAPRPAAMRSSSDAGSQTEPVKFPKSPIDPPAPKADVHSLKKKSKREDFRPRTPPSPEQERTNGVAGHRKTQSFEDYLRHAQAELSELGSVISANEALFAQKIQEHVGGLQRAKDQLAAEYRERFDSLQMEKEQMDKQVSARSAAEFAKDRQRLIESFRAGHEDEHAPTSASSVSLSAPQHKSLRNAEERLVAEYDRRIAKRKSQIALKHAEDFHTLTRDYDRRIADLLNDRDALEGDLSVEPSKFEHDLDALGARSARLEAEKSRAAAHTQTEKPRVDVPRDAWAAEPEPPLADRTPKSQLPKKTSGHIPRAQRSIPRAIPYPGNRNSPEATSRPYSPRTPIEAPAPAPPTASTPSSTADRHPPVQQQYLVRAKVPTDMLPTPRRATTNPLHTATSPSHPSRANATPSPRESALPQPGPRPRDQNYPPWPAPVKARSATDAMRHLSKRLSLRHSSGAV